MTDQPPLSPPVTVHEPTLRHVTAEALLIVRSCSAVAVTVATYAPVMILGTSAVAVQLDQAQWEAGQGPGIDAIQQLQVFNVADLAATRSWPEFTALAVAHGLRSSLAVPVTWRGRAMGALNLYSVEPDGFAGLEPLGLRLASDAALALSTPADTVARERRLATAPTGADERPRERAVS
ncbi:MAG: GAF domain-containing protein [Acidimicrobiales bacterium]